MGRGNGNTQAVAGGFTAVLGSRGRRGPELSASATRSLSQRNYVADVETWKNQETEYIDGVIAELKRASADYASSDDSWRSYLQMYAQTPEYSALNNLWARAQLNRKGVATEGVLLSESAWAALGRRIKAEYCSPYGRAEGRRDRKYGYPHEREWDDRYATEMMQPLGFHGFYRDETDGQGNPILDAQGQPKRRFVPVRPKGYKAFVAYHEDATEALDGSTAPPLPEAPWHGATGSDEDATKLLRDLDQYARANNLTITKAPVKTLRDRNGLAREALSSAHYDAESRTITVDPDQPIAEQAVGTLRAICQAAAGEERLETPEDRQLARAADESAKYVIASLYGLNANDQTFPHLAAISEMDDGVSKLSSRIHTRVKGVLSLLDPKMRAKARIAEETGQARAERRQTQRGKRTTRR
jgi:hypothetical protein